jgi:hypothetical protein
MAGRTQEPGFVKARLPARPSVATVAGPGENA